MKRLHIIFITVLAAALLLNAVPVSASALNVDAKCSLTGGFAPDAPDELKKGEFDVDLYRVASVDEKYYYTTVGEFASLSSYKTTNGITYKNYKLSQAGDLQELTDKALEVAETLDKAHYTAGYKNGKVEFTELPTGLYLVVPRSTEAGEHTYSFSPILLSLPSLVDGYDEYNVSVTFKFESGPRYGKLIIEKNLLTFGEPATFIFLVEAYDKDKKLVYSDVVKINFTKEGTKSKEIAQLIPLGSDITVTEVYSGPGYEIVGEGVKVVHLGWVDAPTGDDGKPTGEPKLIIEATTSFTNKHTNIIIKGSDIENVFIKTDDGFVVEKVPFNN